MCSEMCWWTKDCLAQLHMQQLCSNVSGLTGTSNIHCLLLALYSRPFRNTKTRIYVEKCKKVIASIQVKSKKVNVVFCLNCGPGAKDQSAIKMSVKFTL